MPRWCLTRRLENDVSIRIEGEYDEATAQLLLCVFHSEALDEAAWQWRVGEVVSNVASLGGTTHISIDVDSMNGNFIILEPKGCILRWLAHYCLGWGKIYFGIGDTSD